MFQTTEKGAGAGTIDSSEAGRFPAKARAAPADPASGALRCGVRAESGPRVHRFPQNAKGGKAPVFRAGPGGLILGAPLCRAR